MNSWIGEKLQIKLDCINHCALYWKEDISSSSSLKKKDLQTEVKLLKEELSSLSLENAELNDTMH